MVHSTYYLYLLGKLAHFEDKRVGEGHVFHDGVFSRRFVDHGRLADFSVPPLHVVGADERVGSRQLDHVSGPGAGTRACQSTLAGRVFDAFHGPLWGSGEGQDAGGVIGCLRRG